MIYEVISSETLPMYVNQFHTYGHGLENGLSEDEHKLRVLESTKGLEGIAIVNDNQVLGVGVILPKPILDAHYVDAVLHCVYLGGNFTYRGMRAFHKAMIQECKLRGATMYSMPSRKSKFKYIVTFYEVRE